MAEGVSVVPVFNLPVVIAIVVSNGMGDISERGSGESENHGSDLCECKHETIFPWSDAPGIASNAKTRTNSIKELADLD
jgi:hypothetical protein